MSGDDVSDALRELLHRLGGKALALSEMADDPTRSQLEAARLRGKSEGVGLALSFIDECLRGAS